MSPLRWSCFYPKILANYLPLLKIPLLEQQMPSFGLRHRSAFAYVYALYSYAFAELLLFSTLFSYDASLTSLPTPVAVYSVLLPT